MDELDRADIADGPPTASNHGRGNGGLLEPAFPSEQANVTDRGKGGTDLHHTTSSSSSSLTADSSHVLGPRGLSPPGHSVLQQSPLCSDTEEEEEEEEGDQLVPGSVGEGSLLPRHHLSRVGSVFVSEWGVEHALKLKEEEGEGEGEETPLSTTIRRDGQEEETMLPSNALPADSHQENPIVTPTAAVGGGGGGGGGEAVSSHGPHHGEASRGSWWSQALAAAQDIDDFDSLIDNIDSSTATGSRHTSSSIRGKLDNGGSGGKAQGSSRSLVGHTPPISSSSSRRDIERDGSQQHSGSRQNHSPGPQTGSYHERHPSPSSSPSEGSDYIVQAGKLITQGLQFEQSYDYQEALDLFKAGVDVLLNGVQSKLHYTTILYQLHGHPTLIHGYPPSLPPPPPL